MSATDIQAEEDGRHACVVRCAQTARRLALEWQAWLVRTHALRRVFVSVKGFYLQADVLGQPVTWLVPHALSQVRQPERPTWVAPVSRLLVCLCSCASAWTMLYQRGHRRTVCISAHNLSLGFPGFAGASTLCSCDRLTPRARPQSRLCMAGKGVNGRPAASTQSRLIGAGRSVRTRSRVTAVGSPAGPAERRGLPCDAHLPRLLVHAAAVCQL